MALTSIPGAAQPGLFYPGSVNATSEAIDVSSADTSSATETQSVGILLAVLTDTASGSESHSIEVVVEDTVSTTDTQALVAALSSSDTALVTDSGGTDQFFTPTGFTAVSMSESRISLSWDAVGGATYYEIERNSVVVATNITDNTYEDIGLSAGTVYTYRLRAVKVGFDG